MTSPIPGIIAWPVLMFMLAVVLGRRLLVNDTHVDRLVNRAMSWGVIGLVLREAWAQELIAALPSFDDHNVINLMRQLSFGCILLSVANIYGISTVWAGVDPETARRRQWRYDVVAVVITVVILIAGTPARRADLLIDQYMGWEAVVAWCAFYAPLLATALLVGRVSVRELRGQDVTARERVIYLGILALAVGLTLTSVATLAATILDVTRGTASPDPQMVMKALTYFVASFVGAVVVAVPLVSTVATRTGWDRTGRYCRRLQPLWSDLTTAVPEIVMQPLRQESGRIEPATRLHRMIVEIRDCLLHLKQYSPVDITPGGADPHDSEAMQAYAAGIVAAIDAKASGAPPVAGRASRNVAIRLGARDLTAELEQLVGLADAWPKARQGALP
jgi:hypothetical protein